MVPYFSGEKAFPDTCSRIGVPDDCVIGFISEYLLNVKLKEIHLFHSHLEWLGYIPEHTFHDQVSFSHGILGGMRNHIQIDGPFSIREDASRFMSLHCYLYPHTSWCPGNQNRQRGLKNNG
ncbi:beta-1,3-N-acetylglucosaminyltransferase lunatic fringe-like [Actinia tenebrosa]|uniref:Beta-1,3-N-acetylglucosaminyltransferase lunatic fringe-like n=1 Tax=Actinia tenebrosa TaxID=6105 RepID=A0A6P8HES5_ACTTE|nr:beta-1,3-N-acetylglucosaminyltransferase lunatic fringe-like [Actinia tenebrosa]